MIDVTKLSKSELERFKDYVQKELDYREWLKKVAQDE